MPTSRNEKIRSMTLIAMLTAMGVVLWIIKIPIPNVQPVTDMVMIITLVMGVGFGFTLAVLTNKASVKRINQRLQFARQLKLGPNYQQSIYDLSTANQRYYEQAISLIKTNYGGMTKYIHDVLQVSDSMVE